VCNIGNYKDHDQIESEQLKECVCVNPSQLKRNIVHKVQIKEVSYRMHGMQVMAHMILWPGPPMLDHFSAATH